MSDLALMVTLHVAGFVLAIAAIVLALRQTTFTREDEQMSNGWMRRNR